jgi:glycosyltransferase involved in cell wall biosynthesis
MNTTRTNDFGLRDFGHVDSEIAYILKGYPRLSEAFITNEISWREKLGLKLHIFAIKKEEEKKSHAVVNQIHAPVTYLPPVISLTENNFLFWLWKTLPQFAKSHLQLFKRRPATYARTLWQAVKMCFKYRSGAVWQPKKVYFKEFLQTGDIARRVIESGRIRHLHAHFCHGSTNIAMLASRLAGMPFSFTAHAKDIYQEKLNPRDLLSVKIHQAQFVATCTEANRRRLQQISANGTPIQTIYHGLNTSLFTPVVSQNSRLQKPLILSVGRFVEKKGFSDLVLACRTLKKKGHDFQCRLVGEKGDQWERIQQMIATLQLDDCVSMHREMTHHELRALYQQSTIFALPCRIAADGDQDGIPNVLAEAMATGLPVVSTYISGIPELVTHDVDGLLIEQKNVTALAEALEKLLANPALRQQLGNAARARICEIFDAKRNTEELKRLFHQESGL